MERRMRTESVTYCGDGVCCLCIGLAATLIRCLVPEVVYRVRSGMATPPTSGSCVELAENCNVESSRNYSLRARRASFMIN
jgi:hypothetical protein